MRERVAREQFPATAALLNDPEHRGRIMVKCETLGGPGSTYPRWLEPRFPLTGHGRGFFLLPKVGDPVVMDAYVSSSSRGRVDLWDEKWVCEAYMDADDVPTEFRKNYGEFVGFKSASGAVIMFGQLANRINLKCQDLRLGAENATENLVLGKILRDCLHDFMQAFIDHTHTIPGVGTTGTPSTTLAVINLQMDPVDSGNMLSDVAFTSKQAD